MAQRRQEGRATPLPPHRRGPARRRSKGNAEEGDDLFGVGEEVEGFGVWDDGGGAEEDDNYGIGF